jgi:hypothetical protein
MIRKAEMKYLQVTGHTKNQRNTEIRRTLHIATLNAKSHEQYVTAFIKIQDYHTPKHTGCSLCRLIRLLSTWCRAAAFFSASGAALSQEIPTAK